MLAAAIHRCSVTALKFNYKAPISFCVRVASTSQSSNLDNTSKNDVGIAKIDSPNQKENTLSVPHEFRHAFPDFLPLPKFEWRHPIREKVERLDMLKRRMNIDIPEFYVGSIVAVTCSDPHAPKRSNRFVGICIERDQRGLMHTFLLRNVIDGIAVEVPYDLYNPLIQSIQVLRLERRPDPHLLYLRDALHEYSTFPFDMTPETLPPGSAVPLNMTKVKLKPPPWTKKWQSQDLYGIEEIWDLCTDMAFRRRQKYQKSKMLFFKKYDIIEQYRGEIPLEDQQQIYKDILDFEERTQVNANRPATKRVTTVGGHFKVSGVNPAIPSGNGPSGKTKPSR